ncbi:MAG TPA: protein jag [Nakamurella sp.]|nr:protein jag [Nakamurella sp.]
MTEFSGAPALGDVDQPESAARPDAASGGTAAGVAGANPVASGNGIPGDDVVPAGDEVLGAAADADADGGADAGAGGAGPADAEAAAAASVDPVPSGAIDESADSEHRSDHHDLLVAEGDAAGDYLERLLDILDYDGDIDLDVEGERAVVSIIGQGDVEKLVGERGEVLDALQELTRLAAGMETGQRSRLMLDIAGHRARRREELAELGREAAERVLATGEPVKLGAMNPFERKVVHDAVATVAGVTSSSEGEEPNRRVVVTPAA